MVANNAKESLESSSQQLSVLKANDLSRKPHLRRVLLTRLVDESEAKLHTVQYREIGRNDRNSCIWKSVEKHRCLDLRSTIFQSFLGGMRAYARSSKLTC